MLQASNGLRASHISPLVEEGLERFEYSFGISLGDGDNVSPLSQSQELLLEVYLGNFEKMFNNLTLVIERCVQEERDEDLINHLLKLHDQLHTLLKHQRQNKAQKNAQNTKPHNHHTHKEYSDPHQDDLRATFHIDEEEVEEAFTPQSIGSKCLSQKEIIECPICTEEFSDFTTYLRIRGCGHTYCKDCLRSFLQEQVDSGRILQINCPDPLCDCELSVEEIEEVLEEGRFLKFQQFRFLAKLRVEPNARWCPKPVCDTPLIGKSSDPHFPKLKCLVCGTTFCFHCGSEPYHQGLSCQEAQSETKNDQRKREEEDLRALKLKYDVKECPGCKICIERTEGCIYMTCRCGYKFCWVCGAQGTGRYNGWEPGCNCRPGHGFRDVQAQLHDEVQPPPALWVLNSEDTRPHLDDDDDLENGNLEQGCWAPRGDQRRNRLDRLVTLSLIGIPIRFAYRAYRRRRRQ
eukprot:TRINITY_DN12845_c0_g1_i1.p1 TRINITY_DN12845_c0_g1~~TRINITY_DN12845_c0_g1_i1.p1  ORF type:complete len:461 (+),score=56.07 TRINITY_DN12845_c0_g1_i1:42-1424(+)